MQGPNRYELYRQFMEFIGEDIQGERRVANRRMFGVFFWCFIMPALVALALLLMVKFGWIPRRIRNYMDWLVLIFPITYSLYIIGSEVLSEVPMALKRGGVATTLGQAVKEGKWREKVRESLLRNVRASREDWEWIIKSFSIDLERLQMRTKFLTALAGAVFFLILQGIDSLVDDAHVTIVKNPVLGWVDTSQGNDLPQFVSLGLVLLLLYLTGSQTHHQLKRYLNTAELIALELQQPSL